MSKFLKTLVVLVLGAACAQQLFAAGVKRQKVPDNKVSCDDPIGARSYKELKKNTDELVYLTKPKKKTEPLSEKKSEVNDRRDVRVVWDLKTHTQKLHDWRGQMPPGKRVWVQIIGKLICGPGTGTPPKWQSWSVDLDLDADSNNNGIIDPDPRVPDDNLASEDVIEADKPGTLVGSCAQGPLILRKIKPPLPSGSTGTAVIHRSEKNKLDIFRETVRGSGNFDRSIFPGGGKVSEDFFPIVRNNDLPLRIVALKKGDLNLEARLEARVKFPKRTEKIKFKDKVRVRVSEPGENTVEIVNPTPPGGAGQIQTPANPPQFQGNEFTYSAATPGVLTIPVRVRINPDNATTRAALAGRVRIRLGAINDSHGAQANVQLSWDSPWPGDPKSGSAVYNTTDATWNATATFTTLPPLNSDFGVKACTAEVLDEEKAEVICRAGTPYEVFFPRDETNHPGGQANSPNFYHYWSQTTANLGIHVWAPGGGTGFTSFEGGGWVAHIRQAQRHTAGGTWNNAEGIDLFANIARHEEQHRLDLSALWGGGLNRVPARDMDGDFLPDAQEANLVPGHPYDPADPATYPDIFNYLAAPGDLRDVEDYALRRQPPWTNGSANHEDWASPGMQHTTNGDADD